MSQTENPVRNEAESQFQWTADGETAVLTYQLKPGSIVFMHTAVPEMLEGQHIARKLAAARLEFARQNGLTVIPLCPFVAGYLKSINNIWISSRKSIANE